MPSGHLTAFCNDDIIGTMIKDKVIIWLARIFPK